MRLKLAILWEKVRAWFDYSECYKESLGYRCQHRVYPSGFKECGEYPKVR